MYLILGVQAEQHMLLATPANARDAVEHYEAALKLYKEVLIQDQGGKAIDIVELNRRAEEEAGA